MQITYQEYIEEVTQLAADIIEQASEYNQDLGMYVLPLYDLAHETVDGHQWVIYYAYNDDVIRHSGNSDAWEDCYCPEDIGQLVTERGIDGARMVQAYFALLQDVTNEVHDQVEDRPFTQKVLGIEEW